MLSVHMHCLCTRVPVNPASRGQGGGGGCSVATKASCEGLCADRVLPESTRPGGDAGNACRIVIHFVIAGAVACGRPFTGARALWPSASTGV